MKFCNTCLKFKPQADGQKLLRGKITIWRSWRMRSLASATILRSAVAWPSRSTTTAEMVTDSEGRWLAAMSDPAPAVARSVASRTCVG